MPCNPRWIWFGVALATSLVRAADFSADPLLEPPLVNSHPGPEYQDEARVAGMIIGMDRTPKGRIYGSWAGTGDNTEGYFLVAKSDDGGATWSKPLLAIDPKEIPGFPPRYSLIGNLWCDPLGRMWLFFDQHMAGFAQTGWYVRCDQPDAANPVWSAPVRISDGSTLNKPIIAKSGAWLLPVSLLEQGRNDPKATAEENLAHQPMVHLYASTDEGRSWKRRGGVAIPPTEVNHNEPMFVQLKDGRLWMLMRTKYGIAESFSEDEGRTWTTARPSAIQNPSTRFYLRRLASGRLLLVKNGPIEKRLPGRTHMTAFLSEDEGKSWSGGLLLDERNAVSYPDGFEDPTGLIRILYDRNRHGEGEVLMATFREADILAGKLVSSEGKLRQIINAPRAPMMSASVEPDPKRNAQATADAKLDVTTTPYDGAGTFGPAGDANLRAMPDGSWQLVLACGDVPVKEKRSTFVLRSADAGKTWTAPSPFGERIAAETLSAGNGAALFYSTGLGSAPSTWRTWVAHSETKDAAWSEPSPLPGPLAQRTLVRNPIVARDGRWLAPYTHFDRGNELDDLLCGIIESADQGKSWVAHGGIRLAPTRHRFDWEESNLIELEAGHLVLLTPVARLMATIYRADSNDGGKTWPQQATLYHAPSLGTATFFSLGGNAVAMIHNPGPKLALWISFDGMQTWPYQRILAKTASVGPKEYMSPVHGFVTADRAWVHFGYVDNQRRAVSYSAKLPPIP